MDIVLKFDYGDTVKDTLTGYTGKITGFGFYWGFRPDYYCVENVDNTGRPIEEWIIEDRLKKV